MNNLKQLNSSTNTYSLEKWEIPDYKIKFHKNKNKNYCVVIPVINEGSRISNLLLKMKKLKISEVADIIIIDGGSTDNSLNDQELIRLGTNTLLIKTGVGKLSAQLRCAYAYLLAQGYEGVVTIDGNDKDDPEAIPRFIESLEQGYDFIQGSRFISGGIAENTPTIRFLAIRLIHAPLLRFTSGFAWTDTTQGYRAYSKNLLLNERLAVFRNIFLTYELLAYLSYKAPLLNLKCLEIPTIRRYPKGETPTKISSFRGNWQVFTILIKTCIGKYNK